MGTDCESRKATWRWEKEVLSEGGGQKGTWGVTMGKEKLG